jgi:hypothetical protein
VLCVMLSGAPCPMTALPTLSRSQRYRLHTNVQAACLGVQGFCVSSAQTHDQIRSIRFVDLPAKTC